VLALLSVPAGAGAATLKLHELARTGAAGPGFARTPDRALHVVSPPADLRGLETWRIGPTGHVGRRVTVLDGSWATQQPGLLTLPGGALEAVFGGRPPQDPTTIWGVTSGNGGASWGGATNVIGTPPNQMDAVTAQMSGSEPVLASGIAGTLTVQQGLGAVASSYQLQTAGDAMVGEVRSAVDGGGTVVVGWNSEAGAGGDFLQAIAPATGPVEAMPGIVQDSQSVAGRSVGRGVFAPYTSDGRYVRLLRYGGRSVAVGRRGVRGARFAMADATGPGGRIWVVWDDGRGDLAATRSNRAVTRFEPVQRLAARVGTVDRLWGDGRLGPLDVLVDQVPVHGAPGRGLFYGRIRPVLSVAVRVRPLRRARSATARRAGAVGHRLTVRVTDAGEAVRGARVSIAGARRTTGRRGGVTLQLSAPRSGTRTLRVTAPAYAPATRRVTLFR
jgi:hypothetical protein